MSDELKVPAPGAAPSPGTPGYVDPEEVREWIESLEELLEAKGFDGARYVLRQLLFTVNRRGMSLQFATNTPYVNTIPRELQPKYPGNRQIERRIKSLIRW